jgi:hypothetical protein
MVSRFGDGSGSWFDRWLVVPPPPRVSGQAERPIAPPLVSGSLPPVVGLRSKLRQRTGSTPVTLDERPTTSPLRATAVSALEWQRVVAARREQRQQRPPTGPASSRKYAEETAFHEAKKLFHVPEGTVAARGRADPVATAALPDLWDCLDPSQLPPRRTSQASALPVKSEDFPRMLRDALLVPTQKDEAAVFRRLGDSLATGAAAAPTMNKRVRPFAPQLLQLPPPARQVPSRVTRSKAARPPPPRDFVTFPPSQQDSPEQDSDDLTCWDVMLRSSEDLFVRPEDTFQSVLLPNESSGLFELNLKHLSLGDERTMALSRAITLAKVPLCSLVACGNRLAGNGLVELLLAARLPHHRLTNLDLSNCRFSRRAFQVLVKFIQETQVLEILSLESCGLGDAEALTLCTALASSRRHHIRKLVMSHNHLDSASAFALSDLFSRNTSILEYDLSWNSLRGAGAVALMDQLEGNRSIKSLNLAFNGLGAEGTMRLGFALSDNHCLRRIDLSHNSIMPREALVLATGLSRNSTLQELGLQGNSLGRLGGRAFLRTALRSGQLAIGLEKANMAVHDDSAAAFDPDNPQGKHVMDLSDMYERAVATELLRMVSDDPGLDIESLTITFSGGVQRKVALEKHYIPIEDADGALRRRPMLREVGDTSEWELPTTGRLNVQVSMRPQRYEQWRVATSQSVQGFIQILQQRGLSPDERTTISRLIAEDLVLTGEQAAKIVNDGIGAHEGKYEVRDSKARIDLAVALITSIVDKQGQSAFGRLALDAMERASFAKQLGQLADFCLSNPTGHYRLDLSVETDRRLLKLLLKENNVNMREAATLGLPDTSEHQNREGFRNARLNRTPFIMKGDLVFPSTGTLEFDFVSTMRPSERDQRLSRVQLVAILCEVASGMGIAHKPFTDKYNAGAHATLQGEGWSDMAEQLPTLLPEGVPELKPPLSLSEAKAIHRLLVSKRRQRRRSSVIESATLEEIMQDAKEQPSAIVARTILAPSRSKDEPTGDDLSEPDLPTPIPDEISLQGGPKEEKPATADKKEPNGTDASAATATDDDEESSMDDPGAAVARLGLSKAEAEALLLEIESELAKQAELREAAPAAPPPDATTRNSPPSPHVVHNTKSGTAAASSSPQLRTKAKQRTQALPQASLEAVRTLTSSAFVTTEQAIEIMRVFPSDQPLARAHCLIILFGRLWTLSDLWKRLLPLVGTATARRVVIHHLGWLNVFHPAHAEAHFHLHLSKADQHKLMETLLTLALAEPGPNLANMGFAHKNYWFPGWRVPASWIEEVPRSGQVTLSYVSHGAGCIVLPGFRQRLASRFFLTAYDRVKAGAT